MAGSGAWANRWDGWPVLTGVKTTLLAAGVVALVVVTGCGAHNDPGPASKAAAPSKACDPADDSCIPPDHPTVTSPVAVPVAEVGKPLDLQLPTSNGTAQIELTLTGLKVKPRTAQDPKSTQVVCYSYKVRNTGTTIWTSEDTHSGVSWTWFGLDGEMAEPGEADSDACDEFGHQWAGDDQPAPLPGRFVQGYEAFTVPAKPGAVEVEDGDKAPLFRLNYGPRSAQVPIDARGR